MFRRNLFKGSVTSFRRKKVYSLHNSFLENSVVPPFVQCFGRPSEMS